MKKVVAIQAMDGTRWRTIATVRLKKIGGKFAYSYRFTRTTRPSTFRFRALAQAENGWPFATGSSNTVTVKVRP